MYINFAEGTPFWYWYFNGGALAGFGVTVLLASMTMALGNWRAGGIALKTILCAAVVTVMPLGLASMGLRIAITNPPLVAYLSMGGTAVALVFGLTYLIGRTFSKGSNRTPVSMAAPAFNGAKAVSDVTQVRDPKSVKGQETFAGNGQAGLTIGVGAGNAYNVSGNADTAYIGRASANDIVIEDPSVSRKHARVTCENDRYFIEDLGSLNGTRVDGVTAVRSEVTAGSVVKLGKIEVSVGGTANGNRVPGLVNDDREDIRGDETYVGTPVNRQMGWLTVNGGAGAGTMFYLSQGGHTIGRDAANDFVIDDPYASSRHGLIKVDGANVTVFDLGSAGGVKVNETVLTGWPVNPGNTISVGDTRMQVLQVDSPDQFASVVNADETMVDLKNKKTVALVAISGPDAGKSYMISEGDNVIGRNPACQVALSDKAVSRKHALIRFEGSKLTAFNLGGSTTTEVDGMKLDGLNVFNGDLLTIGKTELTFVQAKS